MKTNLEIYHNKDDQMWYVYDKTDDNHEYIFDLFEDVSRWVEGGDYFWTRRIGGLNERIAKGN